MQNGLRRALNRAGSVIVTAVIIVLFLFTTLKLAGAEIPIAWIGRILTGHFGYSRSNSEPVLTAFLERLPPTLELIIASFIIAAIVGSALALLSARAPISVRPILVNLALPLRCVPFFWLAIVAQTLVGLKLHGQNPFGMAGLDRFDLRDRLAHVILPALVLASVQIPAVAEYLSRDGRIASRGFSQANALLTDIFNVFAERFPEVIGAVVLTELLFAWPGDGRLFFNAWGQGDLAMAVALVLFGALAALLTRFIAATFTMPRTTDDAVPDV